MNVFMLPSPQRLDSWGSFRDSLVELQELQQLKEVATYWAMCPYSKWTMDPEDPKTWLSVWEMLHEGDYCKNAIGLGIETTLRLSGWAPERLQLAMCKNVHDGEEFFIVIIDSTHVLNYSCGELVTVDDLALVANTKYSYRWVGRRYERA